MAGSNRARLDAALARALPQVQPPPRDPLDGFGAPRLTQIQAQAPFPFPQRPPPADWERQGPRRPGATIGAMAGGMGAPFPFPQPGPEQEYERERRIERDWAAGRNIPERPESVPLNPIYEAGRNVGEVARGLGDYGRDWVSQGMPMEGYEPPPVGQLGRETLQNDRPGLMVPTAPVYREPPPFPFSPAERVSQFQPEAPLPSGDPLADLAGRPGFAPPSDVPLDDEMQAMWDFEAELARAGIATARARRDEPLPDPRARFFDGPLATEFGQDLAPTESAQASAAPKAREMRKVGGPDSKNLQRDAYRPIGGGPAVMDLVEGTTNPEFDPAIDEVEALRQERAAPAPVPAWARDVEDLLSPEALRRSVRDTDGFQRRLQERRGIENMRGVTDMGDFQTPVESAYDGPDADLTQQSLRGSIGMSAMEALDSRLNPPSLDAFRAASGVNEPIRALGWADLPIETGMETAYALGDIPSLPFSEGARDRWRNRIETGEGAVREYQRWANDAGDWLGQDPEIRDAQIGEALSGAGDALSSDIDRRYQSRLGEDAGPLDRLTAASGTALSAVDSLWGGVAEMRGDNETRSAVLLERAREAEAAGDLEGAAALRREFEAAAGLRGVDLALGAAEFSPGLGIVPDVIRAGSRGPRAAGGFADELLAPIGNTLDEIAGGIGSSRARGVAAGAGAGVVGVDALEDVADGDPIRLGDASAEQYGVGALSGAAPFLAPMLRQSGEGTLRARRIGDPPRPIDVDAFPVSGPADATARRLGLDEDPLAGLGPTNSRRERINLPHPFVGAADVIFNPSADDIESILLRQGDLPSVRWGVTHDGELMVWDGRATSHGAVAVDPRGFGSSRFRASGEIEDELEIASEMAAAQRAQQAPSSYHPDDFAAELGISPETAERILARDGRLAFPSYGRRQVRAGEQVNRDGSVTPASPIDYDAPDVRLRGDLGMGDDGRFYSAAAAGGIGGGAIGAAMNSEAQADDGSGDPMGDVTLPILGVGIGAAAMAAARGRPRPLANDSNLFPRRMPEGAVRGEWTADAYPERLWVTRDAAEEVGVSRATGTRQGDNWNLSEEEQAYLASLPPLERARVLVETGEEGALTAYERQLLAQADGSPAAERAQSAWGVDSPVVQGLAVGGVIGGGIGASLNSEAQAQDGNPSDPNGGVILPVLGAGGGAAIGAALLRGRGGRGAARGIGETVARETDDAAMAGAEQMPRSAALEGEIISPGRDIVSPADRFAARLQPLTDDVSDLLAQNRALLGDYQPPPGQIIDVDALDPGRQAFARFALRDPNGALPSASSVPRLPDGGARGPTEAPTARGIGESETPFTDLFGGSVGMSGGRPSRRAIGDDPLSGVGQPNDKAVARDAIALIRDEGASVNEAASAVGVTSGELRALLDRVRRGEAFPGLTQALRDAERAASAPTRPPVYRTRRNQAALSELDADPLAGVGPSNQRLNGEGQRTGNASGTEADFLEALPTKPEQWREAMALHPWINSPSRAQAIIMASARNADGSFVYPTNEIVAATGMTSESSLNATLSKARAAGVPIPRRRSGPEGSTAPPGGSRIARILEVMEQAERNGSTVTPAEIAERLSISRDSVETILSQVRNTSNSARNIPDSVRQRLAALDAARTGRSRTNRNGAIAGGIGVGAGGLGLAAFGDAEAQERDGLIERDGILIDPASETFPSERDVVNREILGDMLIQDYEDGSRHVFRVNRDGERPVIEYLGAYAGEGFETPPVGDVYDQTYDPGMPSPDDLPAPAEEGDDLISRIFPAAVAGLGARYIGGRLGARGAALDAPTFGAAALMDITRNGDDDLAGSGLLGLAPVAAAYGARSAIPAIREASEQAVGGVADAAARPRLDADLLADPEFVARRRAFARELPMDAPRSRAVGEPDPMRATPSTDRDLPLADGRLSAYSEFMAAAPTDQLLWMDRLDFAPRPDASRAELGRQVAQRAIGQDIADLPALPPPAAATEPGGPPPMRRNFRTPLEDVAPRTVAQRAGSRPAREVLNTFAEQHGIPRGRTNTETAANIKAAALRDERVRQAMRDWGMAAILGALGVGSVATSQDAEAQTR